MQFGVRYDLRNPPQWRRSPDRYYADSLDQATWVDAHGFALVFNPMMGGMPHELVQESLELIVREVMPHFRD